MCGWRRALVSGVWSGLWALAVMVPQARAEPAAVPEPPAVLAAIPDFSAPDSIAPGAMLPAIPPSAPPLAVPSPPEVAPEPETPATAPPAPDAAPGAPVPPPAAALPPAAGPCGMPSNAIQFRSLTFCRTPPPGAGLPAREVIRFRVLVETGLEAEAEIFAAEVQRILSAETSWPRAGLRFERVDASEDMTVVLAEPRSVDRLCRPLHTGGRLSCARTGAAIINAERWRGGAATWGTEIAGYRHYLVNHEVGHLLGLSHTGCPKKGEPAPIMLPQTKFLLGCAANGEVTTRDLQMLAGVLPTLKKRLLLAADNRLTDVRSSGRRGTSRALRKKQKRDCEVACSDDVP